MNEISAYKYSFLLVSDLNASEEFNDYDLKYFGIETAAVSIAYTEY